jgi:hypothetical protein
MIGSDSPLPTEIIRYLGKKKKQLRRNEMKL